MEHKWTDGQKEELKQVLGEVFGRNLEKIPVIDDEWAQRLNHDIQLEHERALTQRDTFQQTGVSTAGHGGSHDTCFLYIIRRYLQDNPPRLYPPPDDSAKKLATAIANAATKIGITDASQHSFSGPQLLMLLDDMVQDVVAERETCGHWRRLALQFDGHRVSALWWLKALVSSPDDKELVEKAREFLQQPPLSGEEELAKRIAQIAESKGSATSAESS